MVRIENIVKIITYLIGAIGFLSVFRHIGFLYASAFVAICSFSIYFELRQSFLIPRWVLNVVSSGVIFVTFLRLSLDDPVTPALEALVILLCIKFLEEKAFRDYMQIYVISVFLLAGYALLSLDILFLVYFFSLIFLVSIVIVLLTYFAQDRDMELPKSSVIKIISKSLMIPLIAIPTTLLMFVILPRTNYPLFDFLNRGEKAKTGFTDNVRLGEVSGMQEDASTIFRANMERIDDNDLYWRGIVLDYFDGAAWKNAGEAVQRTPITVFGNRILQVIYLEPYENRYLFGLDKPSSVSLKGAKMHEDLTMSVSQNINRRTKYETLSVLSDTIREEDTDREAYLQLPGKLPKGIKDLANELSSADGRETVRRMLDFLKGGGYRYSLKNLPVSDDPLADFLFSHKYGNCEYFASSMAVMLRAAGIPSRVVGGYRGGYYNNAGRYYLVLQKNAHVWVEAYIENEGWLRIDPTPASPETFTSAGRRDFLFRVRMFFDTVDYYWNASVIGYDFQKQVSLLRKMKAGIKKPDIRISSYRREIMTAVSVIFVGVPLFYVVYRLTSGRRSREDMVLRAFSERLGKYGYRRAAGEGLEEFVSRIEDAGLREKAARFAVTFESYYYRDKKLSKEDARILKVMIKSM